jgi:hypothetical protein
VRELEANATLSTKSGFWANRGEFGNCFVVYRLAGEFLLGYESWLGNCVISEGCRSVFMARGISLPFAVPPQGFPASRNPNSRTIPFSDIHERMRIRSQTMSVSAGTQSCFLRHALPAFITL